MSSYKVRKTIFDAEEKVWKAENFTSSSGIFNTEIGLGHLIMEVLEKTPEKITQVFADNESEMTCYEMRVRTLKIASHLTKRGYKQTDVVGVVAMNSENLAPVVFACLLLGLPINTLSPLLLEEDENIFSKTRPKLIFCDGGFIETLKTTIKSLKLECEIITLCKKVDEVDFVDDLLTHDEVNVNEFAYPDLFNVADSAAFIICSSGTTGSPKAVCKSHRQFFCYHTEQNFIPSDEQLVSFNFSTLYWITGIYSLIAGSLEGAKRVITSKPPTPNNIMDIVKKFKVKTILMPPSMLSAFIASSSLTEDEKIMDSLKVVSLGGAHVSQSLRNSAQKYLPNAKLVVIYGKIRMNLQQNSINLIMFTQF